MSNYRFIGVGAAGDKAVIELIESGVVEREDALLLNTTMRDINPNYHSIAKQIGNQLNGSGKERALAFKLTNEELEAGHLSFVDDFLNSDDLYSCIIVTAIGGGTGSGASIALANHIEDLGIHVHICGFQGFSSDTRELKNSLGFAKDLSESWSVEFICNDKFLSEANNNAKKAEDLANKELCKRMKVYTGQLLRDSDQNIDDTELFKINTTSGFMTIEYITLPSRLKNQTQFDDIVNRMADYSKSTDFEPKCSRIGIMLNISDISFSNIDGQFEAIKNRFGTIPDEVFIHIQNTDEMPEFLAIIATGGEIPIEELKVMAENIAARQSEKKQSLNRSKFFQEIEGIDDGEDIDGIDVNMRKRAKLNGAPKNIKNF